MAGTVSSQPCQVSRRSAGCQWPQLAVTGWRSWSASGKACSLKGLWSDQGAHVWLFEVGWMGSVGRFGLECAP